MYLKTVDYFKSMWDKCSNLRTGMMWQLYSMIFFDGLAGNNFMHMQ